MRRAIIEVLKALYDEKSITALNCGNYKTTRITNEISILRNLGIDIVTDRVCTESRKWYGSYRLIRTIQNLEKAKTLIEMYRNEKSVHRFD